MGCDIGKMLRDELAMDILKQSLASLQMDTDWIVQNVGDIAMEAIQTGEGQGTDRPEALEYQIEQLTKKKADVLDAFFSQQITKDEMKLVNERYDRELGALRVRLEAVRSKGAAAYETEVLREDVQKKITAIVGGETDSEAFYKNLLDRMVVHKDKRVEVYLNLLPQKWTFILEDLRDVNRTLEEKGAVKNKVCKNGPSVPISVSSPFSSG